METLLLGGYTRRLNKGIATVQLDAANDKLVNYNLVSEIESPTYLDQVSDFVFSVVKEDDWAGVALLEKQEDGSYKQISSALTQGVNPPCYVSFDPKRQLVYSANYHQGFFEITQITDEGLEIVNAVEHVGSSVHENQTGPHVHYTQVDKNGEYLLVCDLGIDRVVVYNVDKDAQVSEVSHYQTPEGFGPRHLVEHPTLPFVYIMGELSNEVIVARYEKGQFTHQQTISTLPDNVDVASSGAAIRISSDGRFVYASNRGHDSIVVYRVLEDGLLEAIQWIKSGGQTPRDFNFNRDENYIVVGHQDDDVLALFKRNKETGLLILADDTQKAPECVCVSPIV